jgi:hypothetical protein
VSPLSIGMLVGRDALTGDGGWTGGRGEDRAAAAPQKRHRRGASRRGYVQTHRKVSPDCSAVAQQLRSAVSEALDASMAKDREARASSATHALVGSGV